MIISTITEANLVASDCCPCATLPTCPAPRKECESITLYPCGWTLAELISPEEFTGLPDSTIHFRYRTRTDRVTESGSGIYEIDPSTGAYTTRELERDDATTVTQTYGISSCVGIFTTTNYSFEDLLGYNASNTLLSKNESTTSTTSSTAVACDGTTSYISIDYTVSPPDTTSGSFQNTVCNDVALDPELDWVLSGTTLSKTETVTFDPPATYSATSEYSVSLSDPVTVEDMKADIDNRLFPEDVNSQYCTSILQLDPLSPTQPSLIRRARYRFAVPEDYTRTRWEMQWDEVFFPKAWEDWLALKTAYDAAVAAHTAWEAEDPETRGPEPVIPEEPADEPSPKPSLVNERSWNWAGEDWSEWYEMPAPDEAGETRVVNLMVICWRSSSIGQKPTAHGEVYVFPET